MKIALVQLNAQDNKQENVHRAVGLVCRAIEKKSEFILLPEVFNFRGRTNLSEVSEFIPGESLRPLMELAKKFKVFILAGSIYERIRNSKKVFNTSVLISDQGKIDARYRKINLFEARIGKKKIRESEKFLPGEKLAIAKVKDFTIGLTVCYDLRFPLLFRECRKKGADVLCVPSAFTKKTGQAHWEVLLRARAVENLSYVLAPNQIGAGPGGVETYGHSMAVGPWGEILAKGSGGKEEIVYADINKSRIKECRKILFFQPTHKQGFH